MPANCHIDYETRSPVDLRKVGVYPYAQHPDTDAWCAAYRIGDGDVKLWTPPDPAPDDILDHFMSGGLFVAHNAQFERIIMKYIIGPRYWGFDIPIRQWRCTMAKAYAMSLPGALDLAAAALHLKHRKDMAGHRLMMQMAKPRRINDDGSIVWWDDADRRQRLYDYCAGDVLAEEELDEATLDLSPIEQETWFLDQLINDRGIAVDEVLCERAMAVIEAAAPLYNARMAAVTDGEVSAVTNVNQLRAFVSARAGMEVKSLAAAVVDELLVADLPADVLEALQLRKEAGKTSVTKIKKLLEVRAADGRAHGLFQYHAASTGRWGGRLFQPQNLKRPDMDVSECIEAVMTMSAAEIELIYGSPFEIVSNILRGVLRADD
jgi:DNA polymerase